MSNKERVYQALKSRNFFDSGKKDSMEVFEEAANLEDVIIRVERYCNVDKLYFRYTAVIQMFCRVVRTKEDEELMRQEAQYETHARCKKSGCLSSKVDVETFIKLLANEFEAIGVYPVVGMEG